MRSEKDIRKEIDNIKKLEKENIEEMLEIITEGEYRGDLPHCISRASEYVNMRAALEWVLTNEEV